MRRYPLFRRAMAHLMLGVLTLGVLSPRPAHAIGCRDEQTVTLTIPSQLSMSEDGTLASGVFAGQGEKVSSGLFYDTYVFTATDIVSGEQITGSYRVSTFACLTQAVTGTPVPGAVLEWGYTEP